MVDRAARQGGEDSARHGDAGLPGRVGKAQYRVGVGHVEVVADQRPAERREQVVDEHGAHVRLAAAMRVAQQGDTVAPFVRAAGGDERFDVFHDDAFRPRGGVEAGAAGFDDQDVTVGQGIDRARVFQPGSQRLDMQAGRDLGCFACFPADDFGQAHGREQVLLWRRQHGVRPDLGLHIERASGGQYQGGAGQLQPEQRGRGVHCLAPE